MVDDKLEFDEETHTYTVGGKQLMSVTEWVSGFFPKFDEEVVSHKMAVKRVDKSDYEDDEGYFQALRDAKNNILGEWDDIRNKGTLVHKEIEDWINARAEPVNDKSKKGVDWMLISGYPQKYDNVVSEARIFSKKFGLAGTVDLLMVRQDDYTKQRAVLVDWKTNELINTQNRYEYTNNTGPVAFLHSSKFVKYALQLSVYALILEEEYDTIVDKLIVVQLKDDYFLEIPVDFLKETVKRMLRDKQ